ncbi:glycosyltransferase family 2 protein [Halomonas faecis]|uniref:glycosyltransferase family 2 protein n=1 Tax=Halomonas faecis TaxID=1562110 RepID=UPI0013D83DF8|nr:glycosyltransferase family 2 protein [Halomonas faecis]
MASFIENITPVIIVKNGEQHMKKTLKCLQIFRRVVLFDNGSTDRSIEFAKTFDNVEVKQGLFIGFGPTKNLAASYAKTSWVLSLDIDERPDRVLLEELKNWEPKCNREVGRLHRENYFCGKKVRTNGWGGDYLVRVYNKDFYAFNNNRVHEKIEFDDEAIVHEFGGLIHHDAIQDVSQLLDKAQLYSEIYADSGKAKLYPFPIIIVKTIFAFVRSYIIKVGFLSGWRGFSIAFGESVGVYFKYTKTFQRYWRKGKRYEG